jgi:thiamine-phosphate pyrophosphorylase
MSLHLLNPIINLITSGTTNNKTTPDSEAFVDLLTLVEAAVASEIPLIQIREKQLSTRVLYELTRRAAKIVQGTTSRLLINDRFDVALAAGADGVHLTARSLPARVIRQLCPPDFLIGVSTHSASEVDAARVSGADFVLFGPIFPTESKRAFGEPQGLGKLADIVATDADFPVIAIGGIGMDNVEACFRNGAAGIAAIRLLNNANNLSSTVAEIRRVDRALKNHG